MTELEVRTTEEPLPALRRALEGADEALLCVAFVQQRGVNLLHAQLEGVRRARLVSTTVFGSTTQQGLEGAARRGVDVRVLNPRARASYHPKVYLARHGDRTTAVVGSANLTGGLIANHEAVVTLAGPTSASPLDDLWDRAESWWSDPDAVPWRPDVVPASREVLSPELLDRIVAVAAEGPVVATLADGKPNRIVEVTPDGIWVETERSRALGRPAQLVDAWMLEIAWEWLVAHGTLTNRWLLATDGLNVKRSSFVCALLTRFPDVAVTSLRPITLRVERTPVALAAEAPGPGYTATTPGRVVVVQGEPIGGEDARTAAWRGAVASASAGAPTSTAVRLDFVVSRGRRVDLDNLVRPALEGLQDAGVYARGFIGLDALVATRRSGEDPHLRIELSGNAADAVPPSPSALQVATTSVPSDDDAESKRRWRDAVAASRVSLLGEGEVWVDIEVATPRSLKDVLKPVLDGLEPWLGRDPRGRLEFCPRDDRVARLRVRRRRSGDALEVRAGLV